MSAAAGVGAVVGVAGSIIETREKRRAFKINQKLAEQNEKIIKARGDEQLRQFRRDLERLKGKQRATFSKAGVQIEGSALEVLAETAAEGEREIINIQFNTKNELFRNSLDITAAKRGAKNAVITGILSSIGNVTGGLTSGGATQAESSTQPKEGKATTQTPQRSGTSARQTSGGTGTSLLSGANSGFS